MTHEDSGWRPTLGVNTYDGHAIWDHGVGPYEVNCGCVDPEGEGDDAGEDDAAEGEAGGNE
ncbi:hypothetical protein [Halomarina pelagica]|uniref:hypothetical protein n=1 Tax=Halomarina pelagica TaxID=2961599 RepID=UPI0020C2D06F|nr:hypothetical protein [Halomarina sp. BND7]